MPLRTAVERFCRPSLLSVRKDSFLPITPIVSPWGWPLILLGFPSPTSAWFSTVFWQFSLFFFLPSHPVNFFLPSKSLQPLLHKFALACENKDSLVILGEPPPLLTKSSFMFDPERQELWCGRRHRLSILCQTSHFQISAFWVIFFFCYDEILANVS